MVRKKFSKKETLAVAGGILVVLAILTFTIWHQTETISLGLKTSALEEDILQIKEDIQKTEARKAALLSLERVEKIAREELNLEAWKPEQVVYEGHPNHSQNDD